MDKPGQCAGCVQLRIELDEASIRGDKLLIRNNEYEKAIKKLSSQIRSIKKDLFEKEEELKRANEQMGQINFMKEEHLAWSKKILAIGETYQKTKERFDALNSNHFVKYNSRDSLLLRMEGFKRDLEVAKGIANQRTRERDFFRGRMYETEEALNRSKQALNDVQRRMQEHNLDYKAILECKQRRIDSLEKINEALTHKIHFMNRQMGKQVIDLPNIDSLHLEPEPNLGELYEASDLPTHANHNHH